MLKHFLLLGFFGIAGLAFASPLIDVSRTAIEVTETQKSDGSEILNVSVQRIDDLLSDDREWIAKRIMEVNVEFNLVENKFLINGETVPLGFSAFSVQKTTSSADPSISANFSVGLARLEVYSAVETIELSEAGVSFRRIFISEKVVEIDGEIVTSTNAMQLLDLLEDGRIFRYSVTGGEGSNPLYGEVLPDQYRAPFGTGHCHGLLATLRQLSNRLTSTLKSREFQHCAFGFVFFVSLASLLMLRRPVSSSFFSMSCRRPQVPSYSRAVDDSSQSIPVEKLREPTDCKNPIFWQ